MNTTMEHGTTIPHFTVEPTVALVDQIVLVRLTGLQSRQSVTVRAQMRDDLDRLWEAHAIFEADDTGTVDLDTQRPVSGTYADADAMGLFWSMALPPDTPEVSPFFKTALTPTVITLRAEIDGQEITTATLDRLFVAPDVTRTPVHDQGLVGVLFHPQGQGPYPGVLVVGGSGGGLAWSEEMAALLASHGFAALALAYFALADLPDDLVQIPLEYFETAFAWMQAHPVVRGDRVTVMGRSYGSQLGFLLGATFSQVGAVVAYSPGAVVERGLRRGGPGPVDESAWSYRGRPLPYLRNRATPVQMADIFSRTPVAVTPLFLINLADPVAVAAAVIPVENIAGPVLLISGQEDPMWPSTLMADMVMERLRAHAHPYHDRHLSYAGAGHPLQAPYLPTTVTAVRHRVGNVMALGGSPREQAFANHDSWPQVLAFLGETSAQ